MKQSEIRVNKLWEIAHFTGYLEEGTTANTERAFGGSS